MFEKYDGLRGFWNPQKKAFYSRLGRPFNFPEEIVNAMPQDTFLDGELWYFSFLSFFFIIRKREREGERKTKTKNKNKNEKTKNKKKVY